MGCWVHEYTKGHKKRSKFGMKSLLLSFIVLSSHPKYILMCYVSPQSQKTLFRGVSVASSEVIVCCFSLFPEFTISRALINPLLSQGLTPATTPPRNLITPHPFPPQPLHLPSRSLLLALHCTQKTHTWIPSLQKTEKSMILFMS